MKILIVANTTGSALPQQYPELARIASGNAPIVLSGAVTMSMLEMALDQHQIDALHVIGHGEDRVLQLADGLVTATWLIRRLKRQENLKLVFLNSCDSVAIGAELHSSLHCAVITQRPRVDDSAGASFAINFYGAIARGASISEAFNEARDTHDDLFPEGLRPILLNGIGMTQASFQVEMVANVQLLTAGLSDHHQQLTSLEKQLGSLDQRLTSEVSYQNQKLLYIVILILLIGLVTLTVMLYLHIFS